MATTRYYVLVAAVLSVITTTIAANDATKDLQNLIDEEHRKCESGEDSMACIKERAMRFLDTVLSKDSFKLADFEVNANGYQAPKERTAAAARSRNELELFDQIENYIQGHDITVDLPVGDAKVTVSSRNLVNDELNLNVKLSRDDANDDDDVDGIVEGKGKKGNLFKKGKKRRLRKMLMPLMVLILLKAITVIPMAIGILKVKAFNALALGFISFIVSVGLAIFQLCKKIASEHHHTAHITAHGWDGRAIVQPAVDSYQYTKSAQDLAYKGYA